MRQLAKNKQTMYYANYVEGTDIISGYTEIDGEQIPIKNTEPSYTEPIKFEANISFNNGETYQAEYGLNVGDYNAVISADKGIMPFTEQTLIWHKSEPKVDNNGNAKPESADYRIIAIKTSLNEERFVLKARDKNG